MIRLAVPLFAVFLASGQEIQSPQELLHRAIDSQNAGKLDEAIQDYRTFLNTYPNVVQVRSNLGAVLAKKGLYDEAIAEYQRALSIQSDPQVRNNLAVAYYKSGRYEPAIEELLKQRKDAPDNSRAAELLADCYLRLGQNSKVIDLLTPLRKADSENLAVAYMLGTALVREGKAAEGQVIIEQILRQGDSPEARLLIGTTKLFANDYTGAVADLGKAIELKPTLPEVHAYYGSALLATGDPEGARKAFLQEFALNPNNFEANLRLGVLYRQDQDYPVAMNYFEHALRVRPGDLGVRYQIASVEQASGKTDQAREHLESILKEAPNFLEAHVTLATVYYRERRKSDGDRERKIAEQMSAEQQAKEPGQKPVQ